MEELPVSDIVAPMRTGCWASPSPDAASNATARLAIRADLIITTSLYLSPFRTQAPWFEVLVSGHQPAADYVVLGEFWRGKTTLAGLGPVYNQRVDRTMATTLIIAAKQVSVFS